MRTESDLRRAIDHYAAQAPSADELLAGIKLDSATRSRDTAATTRVRLAPTMAAAAVVLTAVGVTAVGIAGTHDRRQPAATVQSGAGPSVAHPCATGGPLDFTRISMRPVEGIAAESSSEVSCSGVAQRVLQSTSGQAAGEVEVFRPGVFDTRELKGASRVSGSGLAGFLLPRGSSAMLDVENVESAAQAKDACVGPEVRIRSSKAGAGSEHDAPSSPARETSGPSGRTATSGCDEGRTLAWKYAPDSWALVNTPAASPNSRVATRLLALAASVDTAHPTVQQVPFRLDTLPPDIRIVDVGTWTTHGKLASTSVGLGVPGRPGCPAASACSGSGEISVTPSDAHGGKLAGTPVQINGHPGYLLDEGDRPDIELQFFAPPWRVLVGEASDRPIPDSTLLTLARSIRMAASVTDRSTWFGLDIAFGQ